jgi:isopenicillin-N epimerase
VESYFSKNPEILYFNSANLSLCPTPVLDAISRYRREFEKNPTSGLKLAWRELWQVQKLLGEFLGASPQDLILRANVTEVLNSFILGVPLHPGDEILVGELEYGSIFNVCRFRSERDSLFLRTLKIPQSQPALTHLTEEMLTHQIVSQISPRTKVLVLSHVIATLGMKLPIEKISEVTRQKGVALIIDGAYAPGALTLDFSTLNNVDFYGCSLYKWLLGPKGTAFGWVHPTWQASLSPLMAGWTTFDSSGAFAEFGDGNRFQEKFQLLGCRDFAPFFAIRDLLTFWNPLKKNKIPIQIKHLNELFQTLLVQKLNWKPLSPKDPKLRCPMTVFRFPENAQKLGDQLAEYLLENFRVQIQATRLSPGWHGIVSPHIYNTEGEVTELVRRLKEFSRLTHF